jgi:hypothetical protein
MVIAVVIALGKASEVTLRARCVAKVIADDEAFAREGDHLRHRLVDRCACHKHR